MVSAASSDKGYSTFSISDDSSRIDNIIEFTDAPILRIGLIEGHKRIDFHLQGAYTFTDLKGKPIFRHITSDLRWRSKVEKSTPSEFVYRVLLKTYGNYQEAAHVADSLKKEGYHANIVKIGVMVRIDGDLINDSRKYRLVVGEFQSEEECEPLIQEFFEHYSPRVIRDLISLPQGNIEFYDAEYDFSGSVDKGFRLIPENDNCSVLLHGVRVGAGFHWEDSEDRAYPGIIEIRIDHDGALMAVNEISIDQYLKGVVPAEMPAYYPEEALKAQAVAARSEVLSKLGAKHSNDPYDLCAAVHCQVYSGLNRISTRSNKVVVETTGEVITYKGRVCDAVYSAVCGGHTENKAYVWNSPAEDYLEGIFDCLPVGIDYPNLQDEEELKRWIDSPPAVFCNVEANSALEALAGAVKYFRWEETYSRLELEKIIRKKTGVDIGTFFGIELLKRGVSGRLYEIEILGSRRNLIIKDELNIRRVLSDNHLKSSCFYTTIVFDQDSVPQEITFHGAGWGHGVGMCQVGAAVMALKGMNYQEILQHYYPNTILMKVYDIIQPPAIRDEIQVKEELLEK